jgi:predicted nucleotidyltransferase
MTVQDLREKVAELVRDFPAIVLIYLFGSLAEGGAGPASDIDLGVLLDRSLDTSADRAWLHHELCRMCSTSKVDVVWLHQAPIELAFAVISRGILLFERDLASRVEFEAGVMSRYGDYLPVLRAQRADFLRGENHAARVQWHREALGRTLRTLGEIRAFQGQKSE